ncbi:MAG: penicillin-binding transpeptidase domain-containing protein [Bacteroidota bacterium]
MSIERHIRTRLYIALSALVLLLGAVIGQVAMVHWTEGTALREQGERQARTWDEIPALRGRILDRDGRTLAVNIVRYDLAVDPTISGFAERQDEFFETLSDLTGVPEARYRTRVRNRSSRAYVRLRRGLTESQHAALRALEIPGLIMDPQMARRYNYGTIAAHVLGSVNTDGQGQAGLELHYEDVLRGTEGRQRMRRDRYRALKADVGGAVTEPLHGESLVLTLDLVLQSIAEEELRRGLEETGARWGSVIAMNPHTGGLLALANGPTYDPNRPGRYEAEDRRNRALTDRLEPGSTFKLVAAAAVVEQDLVQLADTIDTGDGWTMVGRWTVRDTRAHGRIPFSEVLAHSSNVGMSKAVEGLEPGLLYQYARNLGFGQPTGIDLPGEVSGRLPRPDAWSATTKSALSRGYEVDVTPLQVLTAYAALANGGLLVQPYLVAERRDITNRVVWEARQDSIRRAFTTETAQALRPAFEEAVLTGSATAAQVKGLRIAGKTGTARKVEDGRYGNRHRASFVGLFPAEAPEVVLMVMLDEPRQSEYGGLVAAPVFQRIAHQWARLIPEVARHLDGAQPPPSPEVVAGAVSMPSVVGQPAVVAERTLRRAGHTLHWWSEAGGLAAQVETQHPAPGTPLLTPTAVRLQTEAMASDTTAIMPDVRGLSARDAQAWMSSLGVALRIRGRGRVHTQSVAPGAPLPRELTVRCE